MKRLICLMVTMSVLVAGCADPTNTATPRDESQPTTTEEDVQALQDEIDRLEEELAAEDAVEEEPAEEAVEGEEEVVEEEVVEEETIEEGEGDVAMEIIQFYEPDETMSILSEVNQFNEEPDDGFAYVMVLLEVTNQTQGTLTPWSFDFYAEGPEGVVYGSLGCESVLPDPVLQDIVAIRPGANQQGHICFEMREADANAVGERIVWADATDEDFNNLDVEWLN